MYISYLCTHSLSTECCKSLVQSNEENERKKTYTVDTHTARERADESKYVGMLFFLLDLHIEVVFLFYFFFHDCRPPYLHIHRYQFLT